MVPGAFRHSCPVWALSLVLLLASCSRPAKYVIVPDDLTVFEGPSSPHQRYVCLAAEDARTNPGILGLNTKGEVERYGEERHDRHDPVEAVLFQLISEDYGGAGASLEKYGEQIPEYLRLVLRADLAWEGVGETVDVPGLVKIYQQALDARTCSINSDIINFRIRQLRYWR